MNKKPLAIDVNSGHQLTGLVNDWSPIGKTSEFISNIVTPKLSKNTNVGQLVSGIPTAFARVDLFKTAIDHIATCGFSDDKSNLIGYYSILVDEWRGFIACMALDYAQIQVRKIDLSYSNEKRIALTPNVYEPKGAFGNMLLKRASRWRDQNLNENQTSDPYINVIKYKGVVVGATSPESLLFTSTGYRFTDASDAAPWIDVVTGKFTDPLKSSMQPMQVATLHAYVSHLIQGLSKIENYFSNLPDGERVEYTSISNLLSTWQQEIANRAAQEGFELSIGSTPPVSAEFYGPFADLFCHADVLYGAEGVISEEFIQNGVKFDPKNLLLPESSRIAKLELNLPKEEMKNLPMLVLSADVKNMSEKAYFALPLSAQGLNVFGKNVATLVGMSSAASAIKSQLKATYDPTLRSNNLEVVLTLTTTSGKNREFKKLYTSDGGVKNKDILIWPNFISHQWDAYFMYNELPHNGTSQDYRAFPFVGKMEGNYFRILVDENQDPILLAKDGRISADVNVNDVKSELLVLSTDAVADNLYKYEIYRSNKPFKGVRLLSPTGDEGGFLLVNYGGQGTQLPQDWMLEGAHTIDREVRLGVDFGSTSTSIAYADSTGENGFVFKSQRISLMGLELPGRPIFPRENQVFFFQGMGAEVSSNSIKSVLTLHDPRRLRPLNQGESLDMRNGHEVVGGFPCFAKNVPFVNATSSKITLSYPQSVGEVTQIHNMKWEDSDADMAYKKAFIRTLMLQVYATLFAQGMVPTSLKWSYPSSMIGHLMTKYGQIWKSVAEANFPPVIGRNKHSNEPERYTLKVSQYIDHRGLGDTEFNQQGGGFGNNAGFGGAGGFGNDAGFGDAGGFGNNAGFGGAGGFGNDAGFGGAGGFGNDAGFDVADGFGNDAQPQTDAADFMPDDPDRTIKYGPKLLYDKNNTSVAHSLSEAEAVANFLEARWNGPVLNLCFDVGGSTTDISALFRLGQGITMIKQNSVRFAAQRVSQSVSYFPQFRKVLQNTCSKFGIRMVGLNFGNDTYSSQTAPYFFDQILSQLEDNQLEDFYNSIAADCPQLMCVNMYVTGLLMFYAGQISNKLIEDLYKSSDEEWPAKSKPAVKISFAGRGSRLFQWLKARDSKAADQYYGNMFVLGYGKEKLMQTLVGWQQINLPGLDAKDIKYEVSKGLAKLETDLCVPSDYGSSEIIGESGFEVVGNDNVSRPLDFTNTLSPAMLEQIGIRLRSDGSAKKFTEFCGFFYTAAKQLFNWNVNSSILLNACNNMCISEYIGNMPEFRAEQENVRNGNQRFNFASPIIIIEGMKFYDEVLLNNLR